jgi:hypothetical protein
MGQNNEVMAVGGIPISPEPGVIRLPATTRFVGSKEECVTVICDTEAPTAGQNGPR